MGTLKDVLLYLARNVPAGHAQLARMEQLIEEAFAGPEPAPAQPEEQG